MTLIQVAAYPQSTLPWSNDISRSQLDPGGYDPARDPAIDFFFGNYASSIPRVSHGGLVERDILVSGNDPLHPLAPGAVLTYMNRFTWASLLAGTVTAPFTLKGEQEILYVISGSGTVSGGNETFDISPGSTVLVPEGLTITLQADEDAALEIYLIAEPAGDGFRPNNTLIVRNERDIPVQTAAAHWVNIERKLIDPNEGLSEIQSLLTVQIEPSTFAQPHSHGEGVEEVWCVIEGTAHVLMGSQIRDLSPGDAYMVPPNGRTPHANFNTGDQPVKFLYFSRYNDHNPRP